MHDAYRVDKGGAPTFDRVLRGLERLQKHGVEYNTLTTLHRANADHPLEVYRFLRDDVRRPVHAVHPDHRAAAGAADRRAARQLGLSPGSPGGAVAVLARPSALPPGGRAWSPTAR